MNTIDVQHRRRRKRGGAGLRKARCVRKRMAKGSNKTNARRYCGVSTKRRRR